MTGSGKMSGGRIGKQVQRDAEPVLHRLLRRLFNSGCTGKQLENCEQRRDMSLVCICGKIALLLCRGQSRCGESIYHSS